MVSSDLEESGFREIRLETPRLILHRPHKSDLQNIATEIGDEVVARGLATVPHPYSYIDATNWFGRVNSEWGMSSFTFGLYQKTQPDKLIGVASLKSLLAFIHPSPSLGYWLGCGYWGQGLMSETVEALATFAFEQLNAPNIEATYLDINAASGRVLEKNGFEKIEKTLLWSSYHGRYLDGYLMRLDKALWAAARQNNK